MSDAREVIDNLTEAPKPGLYRGVRFEDYHRWNAVCQSDLKSFAVSAKEAKWSMTHPAESDAMTLGSAVHAMLEPGEFERRYAREPQVDGRTKEGKAAKAAFHAENAGKECISAQLYEQAVEMKRAIWEHPLSSAILKAKGTAELSFTWMEDGLLCKGRIDRFCHWDGWSNIVDFKTTRFSPTNRNLELAIMDSHIHSQLAWYRRGLAAHDDRPRRAIVVFVQNNPPYDVVAKTMDEAALEQGLRNCMEWLERRERAVETDLWPGISNTLETISIPIWGFDRSPDWRDDDE